MREVITTVFTILGAMFLSLILYIVVFEGIPTGTTFTEGEFGRNFNEVSNATRDNTLSVRNLVFKGYETHLNTQWARRTQNDGRDQSAYVNAIFNDAIEYEK